MKAVFETDECDRNFFFPTIKEKLKEQPNLTIVGLWTDEKEERFWLEDGDGYMHEGIEINLN